MKTISILIPDNMEFDEKEFLRKYCTSKNEIKPWDKFGLVKGFVVDENGNIVESKEIESTEPTSELIYPTKELAEAGKALIKLLQWRNKTWESYGHDYKNIRISWIPNWDDDSLKYCISRNSKGLLKIEKTTEHRIMAFPTKEIANQFFVYHRDILQIAIDFL